ncbi:MAG: STAS domain-containing protein [Treponema sp.]|jgi:anti-anti-sigma factor|nr:STAS domain-containing protein [Treponema sp.]
MFFRDFYVKILKTRGENTMTINKTQKDGNIIFTLEGRMDVNSSPKFELEFIPVFDEADDNCCIVLDLEKLTYISSSGLRVLLLGHKKALAKNIFMKLINVTHGVKEILKITGFADVFNIE